MKAGQPGRVLIMAGGTGGHVFPGLAVARHLRERGVDVHWLGTAKGLESRLVSDAAIPVHQIAVSGLRGKSISTLITAPFKVSVAVMQSIRLIKTIQPDVVLGMGGFVSGPGGLAAWLLRCPLIIHEQNAKAGLTNKVLARFAGRILEAFPASFGTQQNVVTVGNPVRLNIENLLSPRERAAFPRMRLLILGGSLGAKALNEIMPQTLAQLSTAECPEVWHQTGAGHFESTRRTYEASGIQVRLTPFIQDMSEAYGWADMVLCRAGALTVAELCAAGLGAIFIPFPFAVDDHQTANANFMVKNKAALCVQQSDLTPGRLADIVRQFSCSPARRAAMAQAAWRLRKVNVAEQFYKILCELA